MPIGTYPQIWLTYGPQVEADSRLLDAFRKGATGVRLTFSYGTAELQLGRARQVRRLAKELGVDVTVIGDLQGEKCRLAKIDDTESIAINPSVGALLTSGEASLSSEPPRIPVQNPRHISRLRKGDVIIEGDGGLILVVEESTDEGVLVRPEAEGLLHPGRGLSVQRDDFAPSAVTAKDERDLAAIVDSGMFDAVAVSFVGGPDDLRIVRRRIAGTNLTLVAKIETALGVQNLPAIVNEADVVMAARGDLALSCDWRLIYQLTLTICQECRRRGMPWIVATQLMEGLERFAFPTRAEASDLAHWILAGAYGAMLSYETAFGSRPLDAVGAVADLFRTYTPPRKG